MARLNLLLLAVLVVCALSLVTSRHQARKLFVELEREQQRARSYETEYGQLQLEQSTWAMPARVEKIAREQLGMQLPGPGRVEIVGGGRAREGRRAGRGRARREAAGAGCRRCRGFARRWCSARSRCCSRRSSARSLYLQWIDNEFLQEQGSARYSREIEVPAHRGRIVDRYGEALAISTPVKSIWAFPAKVEATPAQLARAGASCSRRRRRSSRAKLGVGDDFVFLARQVPPEVADRVAALRIKGIHDQNEYRRFYPGGETTSHILGFTGDRDVGPGGHRARAAGVAGRHARAAGA